MSPLALRKTILAELAAYGDPLTADGLLTLCKLKLPHLALADIVEELSWLRDHDLVAAIADALAPDDRSLRTWSITKAGQHALRA